MLVGRHHGNHNYIRSVQKINLKQLTKTSDWTCPHRLLPSDSLNEYYIRYANTTTKREIIAIAHEVISKKHPDARGEYVGYSSKLQ